MNLADRLRERLREYDDTIATPGQAQDIAELDLLCDVRAIVAPHEDDDLARDRQQPWHPMSRGWVG